MSIYPTFDVNGRLTEVEAFADDAHVMEEPIIIKGFTAMFDRKFSLSNLESLDPVMTECPDQRPKIRGSTCTTVRVCAPDDLRSIFSLSKLVLAQMILLGRCEVICLFNV